MTKEQQMQRPLTLEERRKRDAEIRRLHREEKLSERQIAQRLGWGRTTVWTALQADR